MKKFVSVFVALMFVFSSGLCLAGSPKGLDKKDKTPKGFSQGEKSGWDGDYPKGWDNFSEKDKKKWLEQHGIDEDDDLEKDKPKKKKKHNKKGKKE